MYEIEGDRTSITDAWGNPIRYKVSDGGLLLLGSYGADGVPGGTGRHQDILWIYKTHNSDGQLVAGGELWMVCLEVQGPSRSISLDAQLPDYCADYR
ncbi:MAG: type II secretion system protein GspG [Cyanobacteria bacterium P01_E01_bin.34]